MSEKVYPVLATLDEPNPLPILHLVPEGHDACVICGLGKFRQQFWYTDEPGLVEAYIAQGHKVMGMFTLSREMAIPYRLCEKEKAHGIVQG